MWFQSVAGHFRVPIGFNGVPGCFKGAWVVSVAFLGSQAIFWAYLEVSGVFQGITEGLSGVSGGFREYQEAS